MKAKEQALKANKCDHCISKLFCRECYGFDKYVDSRKTLECF